MGTSLFVYYISISWKLQPLVNLIRTIALKACIYSGVEYILHIRTPNNQLMDFDKAKSYIFVVFIRYDVQKIDECMNIFRKFKF